MDFRTRRRIADMEDEDIREYEKSVLEQAYLYVFVKCILFQAGLLIPSFMLGRAYEAREAASWLSLFWLGLLILSSVGLMYTIINYFKCRLR